MQRFETTTDTYYKDCPIQAGPNRPCLLHALIRLHLSFTRALKRHQRILVQRLDLRPVEGIASPLRRCQATAGLAEIEHRLIEESADPLCFGVDRPGPVPVRSLLVLLDGDRAQSLANALDWVESWWGRVISPPEPGAVVTGDGPHDPRSLLGDGVLIDRSEPGWQHTFRYCFHWVSGMASIYPDADERPWPDASCRGSAPTR